MSSAMPRGLGRKLGRLLARTLPFKWVDALSQFWVQTRLLFSRSILLMVVAMFALFAWASIAQQISDESRALVLLVLQTAVLSILLHMNLWETEREARTFELLIMRVPSVHRLIWLKLRVSLFWTLVLPLPFFAAFSWFVSIPLTRCAIYLLFIQALAVFIALQTCVVASFVHRGLPTGIIVAVLFWILAGITEEAPLPYKDFYRPLINPFGKQFDAVSLLQQVKVLAVNRGVLLAAAACFYWWLHERLKKTEKWIL
ncbi:MAG TPA: hypothetical protein VM492_04365 [Sumerlaeia bacterium]|nr:hypothetical protein [Sumerlaeia bacterium]